MIDTPFQRHDRIFEDFKYCYPVISRRSYGLSIGINLSRRKECNFDCPYCQVDRTIESKNSNFIDLELLEKELLVLISEGLSGKIFSHKRFEGADEYYKVLRDIALSGDGEPTTSKYFIEISKIVLRIVREYRDREILIKPIVITNGTMLHREEVSGILHEMSELGGGPWIKLDASNQEEFERVAESKILYSKILENIITFSKKNKVVLQMIYYLDEKGTESFNPNNMLNRLKDFISGGSLIDYIQLYTLSRSTRIKNLKPVSGERLAEIANLLSSSTGIKIGIYP